MDEKEKTKAPLIGKRTRNGLKLLGVFFALAIGLFLVARLALLMIPFTIALIISQILEPLIRLLMRHLPIRRNWIATFVSLLFFAILLFLVAWGITRIVQEIIGLLRDIPSLAFSVTQWLENLISRFQETLNELELLSVLNDALSSLFQIITGSTQRLALFLVNGVARLPRTLLNVIITIIVTVIFSSERDKLFSFAKRQLPEEWVRATVSMKNDLIGAMLGYFKAQAKIMIVVAIEIFIGFTILGTNYALLLAIGIAILDALPIFGAGLILIPYSLGSFILGDIRMGIGVGIMYFATLTLRQMLEPRVLSGEIGLHPLLTLASILIGFRTIGVLGMIIGPIVALVFTNTIQVYLGGRSIKGFLDGEPRKRSDLIEAEMKEKKLKRKKGFFDFLRRQKPKKDEDNVKDEIQDK